MEIKATYPQFESTGNKLDSTSNGTVRRTFSVNRLQPKEIETLFGEKHLQHDLSRRIS